jgi:hypothetical protein
LIGKRIKVKGLKARRSGGQKAGRLGGWEAKKLVSS